MDNNFSSPDFNNLNQENLNGQQPTTGGRFAPPEEDNITIRTMESDLERVKSSGGNLPTDENLGNINFIPSGNQNPESASSFQAKEAEPYFEAPNINPSEVVGGVDFNQAPSDFNQAPSTNQMPNQVSNQEPLNTIPEDLSFSPINIPPAGGDINQPQEFISPEFPQQVKPKSSKSLILIAVAVILVAGGVLGYFVIWPKFAKPQQPVITPTTTSTTTTTTTTTLPPSPFISISSPYQKSSFEIKIIGSLVTQAIRNEALSQILPPSTFKVLIPIHNELLSNEEVMLSLIPSLPERLQPYLLARKYLVYSYYGEVNPSLGLIVEIGRENQEAVKNVFLAWEKGKILDDLSNFILVEKPSKIKCTFQEKELLGATVRFCDFGKKELGIGYAFFDDYLIISSSEESIQNAISHLQGTREPIYPSPVVK